MRVPEIYNMVEAPGIDPGTKEEISQVAGVSSSLYQIKKIFICPLPYSLF